MSKKRRAPTHRRERRNATVPDSHPELPKATTRSYEHWIAISLIVAMCAMLFGSVRHISVTVDEFAHLPAGLSYYQKGEFSAYNQNPPLLRLIAAAPLALRGVTVSDTTADRWLLGYDFMESHAEQYQDLFMTARLMMLLVTAATAGLLYAIAARAIGKRAALVALTLFCFSPTVLAHGALVTTDAGFACAFLATCAAGAGLLATPSWNRTLLFGAVLGVAQLTKFTALLLYPISILVFIVLPPAFARVPSLSELAWSRLGGWQRAARFGAAAIVSLVVLNAGYLFQGTGAALAGNVYSDNLFASLASGPLGLIPLPFPREFLLGLDAQMAESSGQFMVYLFGKSSGTGWWYYDPVALFLKEPLPLWIMLGILGADVVRRKTTVSASMLGAAAITFIALTMFIVLTNIDIGVRYLLFLLPLIYLLVAHMAVGPATRARRVALGGLLAWYCASSAMSYPNYLSYFSDAIGGNGNCYHYLADSNLDWGQDLIELKQWMTQRGVASVALSHFGLVDPAVYGITAEPLSDSPRSSTVVISINHLLGIQPWDRSPSVAIYRNRTPRERIGQTLWVFDAVNVTGAP